MASSAQLMLMLVVGLAASTVRSDEGDNNQIFGCENTDVTLQCPVAIHVISAHFGRTRSDVCAGYYRSENTGCTPVDVTETIKRKCDGKKLCEVNVHWRLFEVDPCPGDNKYLDVVWACDQGTLACRFSRNFGPDSICYKTVFNEVNWNTAADECTKIGGFLAEPSSKAMMDNLQKQVPQDRTTILWLGAKGHRANDYTWTTSGQKITYSNWNTNEPNNDGINCLSAINRYDNKGKRMIYGWNDAPCNWDTYAGYVCEKHGEPCKDWDNPSPDNICYKIETNQTTWSDAADQCQKIGGSLAEPNCKAMMDNLQKQVPKDRTTRLWLGAKGHSAHDYTWTKSGQKITNSNWNTSEPNCLSAVNVYDKQGKQMIYYWNDAPCNDATYAGYVCEKYGECNDWEG